jgi:hypothetical protein
MRRDTDTIMGAIAGACIGRASRPSWHSRNLAKEPEEISRARSDFSNAWPLRCTANARRDTRAARSPFFGPPSLFGTWLSSPSFSRTDFEGCFLPTKFSKI